MEASEINKLSLIIGWITLLAATCEYASNESLRSHFDGMRMRQVTGRGIGEVPSWVLHQKHESRLNMLFV
jgi:hypothetical protein